MSLEREIRRRRMIEGMKASGMRSTCRKCGTKLTIKPGYGQVCEKCGWTPSRQKEALEQDDK